MIATTRMPVALDERRRIERAAQTRLLLAHERALEAHMARTLTAGARRIGRAYTHGGQDVATRAVGSLARQLERVMVASLTATARGFADHLMTSKATAFAWSTKSDPADLDTGIATHVRLNTGRRITAISEAMRATIVDIIEQGLADNAGIEEIAQRIVIATGGEIAAERARRIARTEVHNAAMYGQHVAALLSPLEFTKEWLATEDSRTRYAHDKAAGQRVALDQPFRILLARDAGSDDGRTEPLRYPGDLDASPGNTINCRCACMYSPVMVDDAQPAERVARPVTTRPEDLPQFDFPLGVPLPGQDIPVTIDVTLPPEREERVVWSMQGMMALGLPLFDRRAEFMALAGTTVMMRGHSTTHSDPDAPPIASYVANVRRSRLRNWTGDHRVGVWRITVPAGAAFPDGFLSDGGATQSWAAAVGTFPAIPLTIDSVEEVTWDELVALKRSTWATPTGRERVMLVNATMDLAPLTLHTGA